MMRAMAGKEGDASSSELADGDRRRRRSVRSAESVLGQAFYKGVEPRATEYSDLSLEQHQSLEAFEVDGLASVFFSGFDPDPDSVPESDFLSFELLSDELSEEVDSDFLSADSPDFLDGDR